MVERSQEENGGRQSCVFVVGPEGSGSTCIARILSQALNGGAWSGRGFNCCDDALCDEANGFTLPCRAVQHLVCHRSLPFMGRWPPIEDWRRAYDCRFVLCTRDQTIAQFSSRRRFGTGREKALQDSREAQRILGELLSSDARCFLWSYETAVHLERAYFDELVRFIDLPIQSAVDHDFRDENRKYIRPAGNLFWSKLRRRLHRSTPH